MRQITRMYISIIVGGLLLLMACGYPAGYLTRQAVDGVISGIPGGAAAGAALPPGHINEQVEVEGVALTVQSVEHPAKLEGAPPARLHTSFVVVAVQIENNSQESLSTGMLAFELSSDDGTIYKNMPVLSPDALRPRTLQPGERVGGLIGFAHVPEGATGLVLQFHPLEFRMKHTLPIRIALEHDSQVAIAPDTAEQGDMTLTPAPATAVPVDTFSTAAPGPGMPQAVVVHGGNLRSENRVAPDTVIAQVCPDDQVELLDQASGWQRIRIVATAESCVPDRAAIGMEGWVSGELISLVNSEHNAPAESTPDTAIYPDPTDVSASTSTPAPTVPPDAPIGVINTSDNLRTEPRIADDTVIGPVCPGDTVAILDEQQPGDVLWYRLQVTSLDGDCHPARVRANQEGWISSVMVTR